ncbi:MAG: diaminopimelate decarboxylase [Planctomycetota bacterium]|jgi:diaminopimelate decarboxylase
MDYFAYRDGQLHCEDVPVESIADRAGTPLYVYSAATLREHYRRIAEAFAELDPTICFSVKALANVHILRLLAEAGSGFDVVSGGELHRAQQAGADMSKVVFAGVGKTDAEILAALEAGIRYFNVESEAEFESLARLAAQAGARAHAALRINPDVDPKTHRYTTTGKKETKFGVDLERAERFFGVYGRDANVALDAIHLHIGSPVYTTGPYVEAVTKALDLIDGLRRRGQDIRAINIGGGYGADYEVGQSPLATEYAAAIVPLLKGADLAVVLEPGRQIACNAGVLLTRVLYVKESGDRKFVIIDGAMTDLIRPALYQGFHFIWPARSEDPPERSAGYAPAGTAPADVVGGVCESSDFLARDRMLPPVDRGDLLAVFSAGAYGFVMSSQYNSRPRAAEVLVEGDAWRVIRRRETYDDLLAAEVDASDP